LDRDEILRSIQENFLSLQELKDMSGFKDDETMSMLGEDIDFLPKLKSLFRIIRGLYLEYQTTKQNSPLRSKNNLYDSVNPETDKVRLIGENEELKNDSS